MKLHRFTAATLVASALLLARPGISRAEAQSRGPTTLADDLGALKRDLLLLLSAGLDRLRMWKEASVVSRHLVATTDDTFEACVAQAAVVWQLTETSPGVDAAYSEWEKLRAIVDRNGADHDSTKAERETCRASYRRVSGNLIYRGMLTSDLGRPSMEKIRVVSSAYQVAVQQGVAADGAAPRR
jgi:hypothetical protein